MTGPDPAAGLGPASPGGPPRVANLAVEAALLLDAVEARLTSAKAARESAQPQPEPEPEPGPDPGPPAADDAARPAAGVPIAGAACPECGRTGAAAGSCTACPLCRALAVLRGERPEVTAKLVDAGLLAISALRMLLPAVGAETAPGAAANPHRERASGDPGSGSPGVERIVIR